MTAPTYRMIAFGDLLMRLSPPGFQRFVQADAFEVRFTGAEANSAAFLAGLGVETEAVSKVPAHEIGDACLGYLRRYGIGTRHVARGGDRLSIFFLETGASQRPSKVVYDRDHTAFQTAAPGDFDWDAILDGADWLHFSGTAPAQGPSVRAALEEGLASAAAAGVTVSCDLNYRAKLWSPEEASEVMTGLMRYVDVLIGNEEDAHKVFGIHAEGSDVTTGELVHSAYQQVATQLVERFGFRYVATTLRSSISASINGWAGMVYDGDRHYVSRSYEIHPVIDRVGGGDSFSGGLIYGMLHGWDPQQMVDFAAAASCLKHSVPGDFNLVSLEEVQLLAGGDASGRVRR
jgi:2-dehydro-3-deoxygluconokinase